MVSEDIRRQLGNRCLSVRTRTSAFSRTAPTHWDPRNTISPDGSPFTDSGAWSWVAELIRGGCRIDTIVLEKPPNKIGYVILAPDPSGRLIYIKLQLGSGCVVGRSFHYSER